MSCANDYPGRKGYLTSEKVEAYSRRSRNRNQAEARLLSGLLEGVGLTGPAAPGLALDIPSGEGRMARRLDARGYETVESDLSFEMLRLGMLRGEKPGSAVVGDVEGLLPFRDASFDLVLCWRFFHHLPSKSQRIVVLKELARVSRMWIIVSFFHVVSAHNLKRSLSAALSGRKGCRFATRMRDMEIAGKEAGLRVKLKAAQAPFLKDLWAVVFMKETIRDGMPL